MHEHYELWVWGGKEGRAEQDGHHLGLWGKTIFLQRYRNEPITDVLSRAEAAYHQQMLSMPKCPAKLVCVRAEDEFYGRS